MKKYRARQVVKINLRDHYQDNYSPELVEVLILRVIERTYDVMYKNEKSQSVVLTIGEFEIIED
jgi:hypothetical protein